MCIVKQACRAGHMVIHLACLLWSITFCTLGPHTSFAICCGVEHWGQGVLHQVYLASGTRKGGWSMIKVVSKLSIIDAPWTPSPLASQVSSLHHHPHQFLQLTSLQKFL